ncbi:hypothetical protein C0J52_11606 [Blattella germanica]|nr:hypothetical protein C0J52_11606 [Blattella germanica]
MRVLHKILLNLVIAVVFFVLFYVLHTSDNHFSANFENLSFTLTHRSDEHNGVQVSSERQTTLGVPSIENVKGTKIVYNIWCIFTKVTSHAPMKNKFRTFANSLLVHTSGQIALHIITDRSSRMIAEEILAGVSETTQKNPVVKFYDVDQLAEELRDIVSAMQPHFSSQPGTYYSDALFFLSLGLHRIAHGQQKAAMFDADTKLRAGVEELFEEFERLGH